MSRRSESRPGATFAPLAKRRLGRRQVLAGAAAGAAVGLGAPVFRALAAEPITIGILLPLSGIFAAPGQMALKGLKLSFDEIGSRAGDRSLSLVIEDEEGKPDVAVSKARKLVERDGAQVLTGIISSGVALAVSDYSKSAKVPLVLSGDAADDQLTMPGAHANPYLVRVSENNRSPAAVAADWAYKRKGWRKVTLVGSDYDAGVNILFAFARAFSRLGGTVLQVQYPPLSTADYGPYLTNLDRSADAMVNFTPGAAGLRLGRQYGEFGLHGKLPALDLFGTLTYEPYLPQLGDAVLGVYSTLIYSPLLKTPLNERFVAAFKKRFGGMPTNEGPSGWVGARAIAKAIAAVHGDLADKMKFMAALKAVEFDSPKGPISLDKYGMVVQSFYVREVEKVHGQLANVPIATYPHIDQFWPYTEVEFQSFKHSYHDSKNKLTDRAWLLAKK